MRLKRLTVANVRNLVDTTIAPAASVNLFYGPNASGKSSALEAIHVLSCGRSFRTHHLESIVRRGEESFMVIGEIVAQGGNAQHQGLEFTCREGRVAMRAAGRPVHRTSELASRLPTIAIHQDSHRVLSDGPRYRRRFLDWGLFHVEPSFSAVWRRYARALKQRNSSLRGHKGIDMTAVWDHELQEAGEAINMMRAAYLGRYTESLARSLERFTGIGGQLTVELRPGWPAEEGLREVLRRAYPSDRALGHTQKGPHRADLVFRLDGAPLVERISRGQQKLALHAIYLAQAEALRQLTGKSCVILIDDLTAELDRKHARRLLELLTAIEAQVFVTATERPDAQGLSPADPAMFHVEHGRITPVI